MFIELIKEFTENNYKDLRSLFRITFLDTKWVHRINENITFSSETLCNIVRTSIDFECNPNFPIYPFSPNATWKEREQDKENQQILMPLGFLSKEALPKLDIIFEGKTCPTPTSSTVHKITISMMQLFVLEQFFPYFTKLEKTTFSEIRDEFFEVIENTIKFHPVSNQHEKVTIEEFEGEKLIENLELPQDELEKAKDIYNFISEILSIFKLNFILYGIIPRPRLKRNIIKFERTAPVEQLSLNSKDNYKIQEYEYPKIPRIWRNASHHIYIEVPKQLNITPSTLSKGVITAKAANNQGAKFILNVNNSLASTFSDVPKYSEEAPTISCKIHLPGGGVKHWANISIVIFTTILIISLLIRFFDWSPNFKVPNSSVGILTSSISILFAFLSREPEHFYVKKILKPYGKIFGLCSFNLFLISILASIPLNKTIIDTSCFAEGISIWDLTWVLIYGIFLYTLYIFIKIKSYELALNKQEINFNPIIPHHSSAKGSKPKGTHHGNE